MGEMDEKSKDERRKDEKRKGRREMEGREKKKQDFSSDSAEFWQQNH